ncbi:MAG: glucose 1-dehydrogenase [Planctomycetales bacterium]|nr:glucose 1-dehydrogenase [Planctomycetales bacterium]
MKRFEGKVVLVTGAASGIGLATAVEFAREGATVVASDLRQDDLDAAYAEVSAERLAIECRVQDVTQHAAWTDTVQAIVARHGRLDVLVNNAGGGEFATIETTTLEQWRAVNAVNLEGVFFGMQAAIAVMKESGGAIVNNSSITALVGEPMLAAYSATKGGVRAMTKAAAVDCARRGYPIRINSIHPGYTQTKLVATALESLGERADEFAAAATAKIPVGRLAEPIEIARPILFLASDDASYMTGAELVVDGGYVAE